MSVEPGRQLRERLQPLRAPVPRLRPGGGRLSPQARGHRKDLRPQQDHGRHDPALDARHHHLAGRAPRSPPASTCCARSRSAASPRRGFASGQALAALEDVFQETMPTEMGFAYSSLSYQEKIAPPAGPDLRCRDRVRLPAARRDVRELAAAVGGAARLAAGRARGVLRRLARGLRQQRLRADRQHHAHRPRRQERDPDRRVREGQARRGHGGSRRRRSSRLACASGRS